MIRQLSPTELDAIDLVPQAVIARPVSHFAQTLGLELRHGSDDFDSFEDVALAASGAVKFSLRHYSGHPEGTATVYLPRSWRDVAEITMAVERILRELEVPADALIWQRRDNPDL